MKVARCQYLKEAIPGPNGPFSEISGWAKEDAEEALEETGEKLTKKFDARLERVQNTFARLKKKKKDNDSLEGKVFRKGLHELVEEARRILDGVGREALELYKQYK